MASKVADRGLVLIVEDEALVQLLAAEIVEQAGYAVLLAGNASDALRILEQPNAVTIVFTDVKMPGAMDGVQLAWEVRKRWPGVGVIVASGYIPDATLDLPEGVPFLAKPYRPAPLEKMLSEMA